MRTAVEVLQHQMQVGATERLLGSGDWVSAEELAHHGLRSSRNPHEAVKGWVEAGLIFSIQHEGMSLYPVYALDARTESPQEGLRAVLDVLQGAGRSGWAIAWWLASPNCYLDGRRPKDCLPGPLDELLQAARAETQGIQHG